MFKRLAMYINKLDPSRIMVIGFATVILIGGLLLNLPISTQSGESIGLLDALFTATSAVCVTGLIVVDTATYWSHFGQVVIITLIQIGGLGFMTTTTMFALITKKRINLRERLLIQESLNQIDLSGLVKLTRYVILITFLIEGMGALLLSTVFIPQFGLSRGIWYSIFHAISAFCNAGFDLMGSVTGPFSSVTSYVNNFTITLTISGLIILGGIGFPVILDVIKHKRLSKLNLHSKIVLFTTTMLIVIGTLMILFSEFNNPDTLGKLNLNGKILASIFQSVTLRTAGFNTIDLTLLHQGSIFVMIILMFIGASPASTGGGIKTTTLATLFLTVKSFIFEKADIEVYEKRIGISTVRKSLGIFFIGISVVVLGTLLISLGEPKFTLVEAGFEVVSAFATVGLSIGGTPSLGILGKTLIMLFMFMGRVGSLTIFMALVSKGTKKNQLIRYPEGKIIVG
ncbi:Trk family potassium uptake protein [Romboutsia maritimum]|uniref:Trk family potassium uptake protein n=1 Tax=Romboutsia maritimum TaxID=2020948 RepID=A0A255IAK2_9FIRM|nr:TrkH family potassium uptake protein [Romboutsia maritimum]RDY24180.1 Trk family potassium uptake protein [Romboutsia maritimum]